MRPITFVGIDVGGESKGFHAVALRNGCFVDVQKFKDPRVLATWCRELGASIVAVDAPSAWSLRTGSRSAERELRIGGKTIQCFKTPTRTKAAASTSSFYGWVFNGERLYRELALHFRLYRGEYINSAIVFETFPHGIICAIAGRVVETKAKAGMRRQALRELGYDVSALKNIDFVDAALCAHAAALFRAGRYESFGDELDGFIILPS